MNNVLTVLGVGNPFLDRIHHVPSLPENLEKGDTHLVFNKDEIEQCWQKAYGPRNDYRWSVGGSCSNVIKALTQLLSCFDLNYCCSLIGMAGKDRKEEIEKHLKKIGVNSFLIQGENCNGIVNSFVTPDKESTMIPGEVYWNK